MITHCLGTAPLLPPAGSSSPVEPLPQEGPEGSMERWTLFSDSGPVPSAPEQPAEPSGKPGLAPAEPAHLCCCCVRLNDTAAGGSLGPLLHHLQATCWTPQQAYGPVQLAAAPQALIGILSGSAPCLQLEPAEHLRTFSATATRWRMPVALYGSFSCPMDLLSHHHRAHCYHRLQSCRCKARLPHLAVPLANLCCCAIA